VIKFRSLPPPKPADAGDPQQIVEQSRRRYCRRASEIRQMIARRSNRWYEPFSPLADADDWSFKPEDLIYDEF